MTSLLLDTTVLIDALRGRPAANRIRALRGTSDVPWICAINVEEVVRGLRPDELVGARLATGNPKDFPMAGLTVEHWPVGT